MTPKASKASAGSVSTLPSGLKVVSEDASTTATVTLTFPAGSASEMLGEQGAALLNKNLAFRSGSNISTLLINRTIEDAGGTPFASVDRFGATLGFTVAPEKALDLVGLLAVDCSFEKWDVRDAKKLSEVDCTEAAKSAQVALTESLYAAAYGPQSPAGRPLYYSGASIESIQAFRDRTYGVNGAVLAATGIPDHAAFCTQVSEILASAPKGSSQGPAVVTYLGGESRVAAPAAGYAHVALAFSAAPSVTTSVVKHMFSVLGLESGVSGFSTGSLVGVYAGSESPSGLVDAMTTVLTTAVTPDVVKRAKGLAKAEALFALDGGSAALAKYMTTAVMEGGSFTSAADVAKAYDAVTEAQVKAAVADMLKTNPALATVGDISTVPYHATVASRFA